jgi:GNAT superfamily N-acetyltransferase
MTAVRVAGAGDAEVVGEVLGHGFADDPVMAWVVGGPGRPDKLVPMFGFISREATIPLGATWMTDDGAGTACWTPPGQGEWPPERGARFLEELAPVLDAGDLGRLGQLNELMDAHHPSEPHWYLGSIATRPSMRGRGIGAALLAAGLAVVDEQGLPAYLESSNPRNVSLYLRHGFETVEVVHLPDGPPLTLMWREARAR